MLCLDALWGIRSAHSPRLPGFLSGSKYHSNRAMPHEYEMVDWAVFKHPRTTYELTHFPRLPAPSLRSRGTSFLIPCPGCLWTPSLSSLPLRPFDILPSFRMKSGQRWLIFAVASPWHGKEEKDPVWFLKWPSFSTSHPLAEVTCSSCQKPFPTAVWWFCVTGLIVKSSISF